MKLQLALDRPDLAQALDVVAQVAQYVDSIEAGTPLLIREGIRAVREIRRRYRGRAIVADIKVIDAGEPIAELAFAAGANVVTVLGCASDEVIERVVRSARRYEGSVMADSLSVGNIPERALQLRDLGVASICINRRGLKNQKGAPEDLMKRLVSLVSEIELPVYLAGGIDQTELPMLYDVPLAGVIVGAAIAEASSPAAAARQMRRLLDQRDPQKTRR
ncbi:MAG: orotidine 5'-phosphate decarboxylase [Blastocatellales bacterium]|nr:orotidine 5'-phosphate decarboxylase [Blastocatellales bacterium]